MAPKPPLPYVFNLSSGYNAQMARAYGYYFKELGLKSSEIAIFAQNDTYGQEAVLSAQNYLKQQGLSPDITVFWHEVGSSETTSQFAALKAAPHIKAIISATIARPIAYFIADMRRNGLSHPLITVGSVSTMEIAREISALGLENTNNIFVTMTLPPIDADLPMLRRFYEDFAEFAPTEPTTELALHGYLAMQMTLRALAALPGDLSRENLRLALESLHRNNLGFGGYCQMSANDHTCLEKTWLLRFDGESTWQVIP
jgi:ABC-type branched-subunit amino acid transport system substrate-binding protein